MRRQAQTSAVPGALTPAGQEQVLQDQCERLLEQLKALRKIRCWAHVPPFQPSHRRHATHRGLPDLLIGVRPGLELKVELKSEVGKVTDEQQAWLDVAADRGRVCRSFDEVMDFLRSWRVM